MLLSRKVVIVAWFPGKAVGIESLERHFEVTRTRCGAKEEEMAKHNPQGFNLRNLENNMITDTQKEGRRESQVGVKNSS